MGFDAYAVLGLALINKERGKYQDAIDSLEKLMKNDPKNARIQHIVAECYIHLGNKERAKEILADFLKTGIRNSYITDLMNSLKK